MKSRERVARGMLVGLVVLSAQSRQAIAGAPSFMGLGDLPGHEYRSFGYAVSADGTTVVGSSDSSTNQFVEAFRWTANTNMVGLGSSTNVGLDVSGDGSVVVGRNLDGTAFRWTSATGPVALGQFSALIGGVSLDGSLIAGSNNSSEGHQAFLWNSGSLTYLGDLEGGDFYSTAGAISADGSTVVGTSQSANGFEAFRWTAGQGMLPLGDLAGGAFESVATDTNADGSVVVGYSATDSQDEAWRWSEQSGLVSLGRLNGAAWSRAFGVSADGTTIVGESPVGGDDAFLWKPGMGMRPLGEFLENVLHLNLSGWQLVTAHDVSADGEVIVGVGINPQGKIEAWRAVIPEPSSAGLLMVAASIFLRRRIR